MKKELTINQIREEKKKLEMALFKEIGSAVLKFHMETGEDVRSIDVQFGSFHDIGSERETHCLSYVSVDLGTI